MVPEIPTDPVVALQLLVTILIVPALVWLLAHTRLTGDGKRIVVLVASVVIGVVHAILTQALAAPDVAHKTPLEWLTAIVILAAVVVIYSQAWYILLKGKISATGSEPSDPPERAEV